HAIKPVLIPTSASPLRNPRPIAARTSGIASPPVQLRTGQYRTSRWRTPSAPASTTISYATRSSASGVCRTAIVSANRSRYSARSLTPSAFMKRATSTGSFEGRFTFADWASSISVAGRSEPSRCTCSSALGRRTKSSGESIVVWRIAAAAGNDDPQNRAAGERFVERKLEAPTVGDFGLPRLQRLAQLGLGETNGVDHQRPRGEINRPLVQIYPDRVRHQRAGRRRRLSGGTTGWGRRRRYSRRASVPVRSLSATGQRLSSPLVAQAFPDAHLVPPSVKDSPSTRCRLMTT